jgi:hypothetical protein
MPADHEPSNPLGEEASGPRLLIHLLVLWSFAVIQPTLSAVTSGLAFFFPIRRVDGAVFVATMVAVTVLPPLAMWLVSLAAGRHRPEWRVRVHLVFVALLSAMFAAYVARKIGLGLGLTGVVVIAGAVVITRVYVRAEPVRSFLTVLAPAPLVFLVAFLGFSDASHLLSGGEVDAPAGKASRPAPVVFYLMDELPIASLMDGKGNIDRARFPNFARLAGDATWHRNAVSPAWTTFEAVPAILTGRTPQPGKIPISVDHPRNLFTLLRRQYDEKVIESYTGLCPLDVCPNDSSLLSRATSLASALSLTYVTVAAPKVVERRLPTTGNTWGAVIAALDPHRRVDPDEFEKGDLRLFPGPQFRRFSSSLRPRRPGERPPLYFLHASLPHAPYIYVADGRVYRDHNKELPGLGGGEQWSGDPRGVVSGWQRHLLQTQFADATLGRLMRRLKATGLYDDALVVVVADHGASFIPGSNRRKPRVENLSDVAMVPLFVKRPGQTKGEVADRPVSTLDVLPTLADALDMPLPWRVDGRSTLGRGPGSPRRFTFLGPSNRIPLDVGFLRRQRQATIRTKGTLFGTAGGPAGFYGLGPGRALQGRSLRSLSFGRRLPGAVDLRDADEFQKVDRKDPFVPALVRGTVRSGRKLGGLVVAVNGRVMGSGYPTGSGDEVPFEVMVDPMAFRDGENRVEVLGVTAGKTGPRLHRFS